MGVIINVQNQKMPIINGEAHNAILNGKKVWESSSPKLKYYPLYLAFPDSYGLNILDNVLTTTPIVINNTEFNDAFFPSKIDNPNAHNFSKWITQEEDHLDWLNFDASTLNLPDEILNHYNQKKWRMGTSSYQTQSNPPMLTVNLKQLSHLKPNYELKGLNLHILVLKPWINRQNGFNIRLLQSNNELSNDIVFGWQSENVRYEKLNIPINMKNEKLSDYYLTFRGTVLNDDAPIYMVCYIEFIGD